MKGNKDAIEFFSLFALIFTVVNFVLLVLITSFINIESKEDCKKEVLINGHKYKMYCDGFTKHSTWCKHPEHKNKQNK